jgi:hypothetical protein
MSSLWTPDGERPVSRPADAAADGPGDDAELSGDPLRAAAAALGVDLDSLTADERTQLQAELAEMMRVRREVAATPASEMLANYLMRFFDLATIYLETEPPAFGEAATVIEAFRAVLDGLDDRLGDHQPMLTEALGQLQMVFVQVKQTTEHVAPDSGSA